MGGDDWCFRKQPEIKYLCSLLRIHSSSLQMEICSSSSSSSSNKHKHSESSSSSEDEPIQKKRKVENTEHIKSIFQRALEIRQKSEHTRLTAEDWDEWQNAEIVAIRLCYACQSGITAERIGAIQDLGFLSYRNVLEGYLHYPFLFYTFKSHRISKTMCPQHALLFGNSCDGLYVSDDAWGNRFGSSRRCSLFNSPSRNEMWNQRVDYYIALCRRDGIDYPFVLYQFLGWVIGKWWKRCTPKRKKIALQRAKAAAEATGLPDAVVQFVVLAYDSSLFSKTT